MTIMEKLYTKKTRSYKHNEQINNQNIDNLCLLTKDYLSRSLK
jgi:hypothetical protein